MPEFEDTNNQDNKEVNYIPSKDAKPRSRRRSGGFKNDYSASKNPSIGEVDPSVIQPEANLEKEEAPSQPKVAKSDPSEPISNESPAYEAEKAAPKASPRQATHSAPLGQETLRVIQELEEKIASKKQARDERRKERPARNYKSKKKTGIVGSFVNFLKSLLGINPKKKYHKRSRRPNYKNQKRYTRKRN